MRSMADTAELGLADFGRIVWRRKISIILLGVLAAAAAFGLDSKRTKIYQGSTQVLLTPLVSQAVSSASGGGSSLTPTDVATAAKVISSPANQQAAGALLKASSIPGASVSQVGTTNVVQISVQSADPTLAVDAANAYAKAYITGEQHQAVTSLEAAASQISTKITQIGNQIATVQAQIAALTGSSASSGAVSTSLPASPSLAALQSQENSLLDQQTTLRDQVTQLQDSANLAGGGGQVIGPATLPAALVSPRRSRDTGLAGAIGLVIGVGIAFLQEYADDRIRSEADLEKAVEDIPAIGLIPTVPEWVPKRGSAHPGPHILLGTSRQTSTAAEAYRSLRTSIQFLGLDRPIRSLVITSPSSNEGKSTTVANLATAMAQAGQSVIVLSCDLRKPQLHEAFGLANEVGFTSVMLGDVNAADALQPVPGYESLWVMASGPTPPNPSELLASPRAERLLDAMAARADIVLIDTPPLLPVTDAAVLAARADATLLVVSAGRSTRKQTRRAIEILERVDSKPTGIIVNRIPERGASFYYGYDYSYGYSYGGRSGSAPAGAAPDQSASGDQEGRARRFQRAVSESNVEVGTNGRVATRAGRNGPDTNPESSRPQ